MGERTEAPPDEVISIVLAAMFASHAVCTGVTGPKIDEFFADLDRRSGYRPGMWRTVAEGLYKKETGG